MEIGETVKFVSQNTLKARLEKFCTDEEFPTCDSIIAEDFTTTVI